MQINMETTAFGSMARPTPSVRRSSAAKRCDAEGKFAKTEIPRKFNQAFILAEADERVSILRDGPGKSDLPS